MAAKKDKKYVHIFKKQWHVLFFNRKFINYFEFQLIVKNSVNSIIFEEKCKIFDGSSF